MKKVNIKTIILIFSIFFILGLFTNHRNSSIGYTMERRDIHEFHVSRSSILNLWCITIENDYESHGYYYSYNPRYSKTIFVYLPFLLEFKILTVDVEDISIPEK